MSFQLAIENASTLIFLNLVHTNIHFGIYIAPLQAQGTSMPCVHKIVPQVDKGTSLPCYYVKMCTGTGVTCIFTSSTHFYIIAVKGCSFVEGRMRNCILSSFFVRDVHSVTSCMHVHRRVQSKRFLIVVNMGS